MQRFLRISSRPITPLRPDSFGFFTHGEAKGIGTDWERTKTRGAVHSCSTVTDARGAWERAGSLSRHKSIPTPGQPPSPSATPRPHQLTLSSVPGSTDLCWVRSHSLENVDSSGSYPLACATLEARLRGSGGRGWTGGHPVSETVSTWHCRPPTGARPPQSGLRPVPRAGDFPHGNCLGENAEIHPRGANRHVYPGVHRRHVSFGRRWAKPAESDMPWTELDAGAISPFDTPCWIPSTTLLCHGEVTRSELWANQQPIILSPSQV